MNDKEIFKDHIFGSSGGNNDNDEDEEAAEAEKATYFQVSPKLLVWRFALGWPPYDQVIQEFFNHEFPRTIRS